MRKIILNREKGSFILELLIGLFLSSVTVLGVLYVYANFEGNKRTTAQLGKTIATAAISLYPIQENIKMAGYGSSPTFNSTGCTTVKAFDSTKTPSNYDISVSTRPIDIISSGNNTSSDTIIISYGTSTITTISTAPTALSQSNNGSNANWKVGDVAGLTVGDMSLAYDTANPGVCVLQQITNVTPSNQTVVHNFGHSKHNPPGGFGIPFPAGTGNLMKIDVNGLPRTMTFQISNNQLTQTDNIYSDGETRVVGDNIVMMKAIFGLDKNGDGAVETWSNNLATTDYQFIRGVKVALLARSLLRERKELSGNSCFITTNSQFSWDNGLGTGIMDISGIPDWKCYRYRMLQTTVPIKNLLWPNI